MKSLDETVPLLRKVPLFEGLSDEDLERLADVSVDYTAETGETLFDEGEEGDRFFVVMEGAVELSRRRSGGGKEKLAVRRAGEAFGEMALLNDAPRSATAQAVESTRLLVLDRNGFQTLLDPDSPAFRMLISLAKALRALDVRFTARAANEGGDPEALRRFNRALQQGLLPRNVPTLPGYQLAAGTSRPEGAPGTTIWDAFRTADGATAVAVTRAKDEGLPPAHTLSVTRALLRTLGKEEQGLAALIGRVNEGLLDSGVEGVAPVVDCGILKIGPERLEWAAAGEVPAMLVDSDGTSSRLASGGPSLGTLPGFRYGSRSVELAQDAALLVLSPTSEGLAKGAADLAGSMRDRPPAEVVAALHGAMERAGKTPGGEATAVFVRAAP